jgi:hypothetical protein
MKFSVSPTTPVTHASNFGCVVVDLENQVSTDMVTLSIGTNPSAGVLSGTLSVHAVAGVAVFGPLQISLAGNGYTLVATAPQQRNVFQPGYYYNFPPSGEPDFPVNTVFGNSNHGDFSPVAVMTSITSNPFNVV